MVRTLIHTAADVSLVSQRVAIDLQLKINRANVNISSFHGDKVAITLHMTSFEVQSLHINDFNIDVSALR